MIAKNEQIIGLKRNLEEILVSYMSITNYDFIDNITTDLIKRVEKVSLKPAINGSKHPKYSRKITRKRLPRTTNSRSNNYYKTSIKLPGRSDETKKKISIAMKGRQLSEKHKKNIRDSLSKKWVVYDRKGNIYKTCNLKAFCIVKKLNYTCMSNVKNGRASHHKGWICKKLE